MGEIFPLTHFIRAARSATLQGGTTWDVLGYGVPIIAFPVAAFALVYPWLSSGRTTMSVSYAYATT
jgi:hypothetical protein